MQALATKYRPDDFDSVCSQDSIKKILLRQLQLKQFKNCYLFCGASGCGKTTLARIFANRINDGVGSPIEIDGASNNGVDNVKTIIKSAQERSIDSKYKIYIIDECHALSNAAWQAFLKCIEEPPTYTIFIFCTTDPQKIPATILNRVQRFNFCRVDQESIKKRLAYICEQEGFTNYSDSVDYISRICNGGVRDAIALLDKCAGYSNDLSINNVLESLGNYSYDVAFDLVNAIIDGDETKVIKIIEDYYSTGHDLKVFVDSFFEFILDVSKYIIFKDCSVTKFPSSYKDKLDNSVNFKDADKYYSYILDRILELRNMLKEDTTIKSTVEVFLLKLARCQ